MKRLALALVACAIATGSSLLALRPVPFHASIDMDGPLSNNFATGTN